MSRQERRRQEREQEKQARKENRPLEKPRMIPENELVNHVKKYLKPTIDDTIISTFEIIMRLMAISINAEEGWGTKRTQRLIDRIMLQFDCIISGTLSGKEVIQYCNEKNINVEFKYSKHKVEGS